MREGLAADIQKDYVQVTAVSDRNAVGTTPYNSQITVSWRNNLPSPLPQIGDWWVVERTNSSDWTFVSRMTSGTYNAMHYSMRLNASTCIGRERPVVDDIKNSGVTCVYLKITEGGQAYWDSEAARSIGYVTNGNRIEQVVRRLENYGIAIVFVIDCESLPAGSQYTQKGYSTSEINRRMSLPSVKSAVAAMVYELYEKYDGVARGVCFDNFYTPFGYDTSVAVESEFVSRFGELPDYSTIFNTSAVGWREKWEVWSDFWQDIYDDLLNTVKSSGIGNWPVSVIVSPSALFRTSSAVRTGELSTCINAAKFGHGWSSVGARLDYTMQQDEAAELRSLEFCIAALKRFSGDCAVVYELDIERIFQPDGVFAMLAKYDATNILLSSYETWRLMSDERVIELKAGMNAYSVTEKSTLQEVGFLLSLVARDANYTTIATNHRWYDAAENIASSLLDNLPHKLRILYDDDIALGQAELLSAVVVYYPTLMSEDNEDAIRQLIAKGGINVVVVGIPRNESDDIILLDMYENGAVETTVYFRDVSIRKSGFASGIENFYIENGTGVVGALPALSTGDSYGHYGSGPTMTKDGLAPVFFSGRNSIIAMDVMHSNVLQDLVGRLALYAIGRDGVEQ